MSNIDLGLDMASLDTGLRQTTITGVIVHAGQSDNGDTIDYTAGSTSGNYLEVTIPNGTQAMAQSILDGLRKRGFRYQPFEAANTVTDPAIEIGDNVMVRNVPSVVMGIGMNHSRLMAPTLKAPYDEELDHEFKYEPRMEREFKREVKYSRSRLSINADAITAEVVRASSAEGELSGRITIAADAITSEVARATGAESQIIQRADSIRLSVSSANGTSTFTLSDNGGRLDTQSLDLSVKAVNISGKLTVGQLADGSVVVSSASETEYYLSTSTSSATGGTWSSTMPTWESGKYLWVRTKTTDTKNDNTTSTTYSPANGRYDKNLTTALSTAAGAASDASGAQTTANGANRRTSMIYHSTSGGTAPTAPSAWVTDLTGNQNTWTQLRPEYSSTYPVLYVSRQSETVGGSYSVTTPRLDATTTVIDGAHIITGTVDATKIAVSDLSALNATIGGWTINSTYLTKETDTGRVRLNAFTNPTSTDNAISVATRASASDSWTTKFSVNYGGRVNASDLRITGGTISIGGNFSVDAQGNLTANTGTFRGNVSAGNIQSGTVGGIDHGTFGGGGITPGTIGTGTGSPLSSIALGGIGGGINFNDMATNANGYRCTYVRGTNGYFTGVSLTTLRDANDYQKTAYWRSQEVLTDAYLNVTSRVYWETVDERSLNAISSASVGTTKKTIYYLGDQNT